MAVTPPSDSMEQLRLTRGQALREARRGSGLSARELVHRIAERSPGNPISAQAIYSYEKGHVLLSREAAERIAPVLGAPLTRLLVGDPDFAPAHEPDQTALPSAIASYREIAQHSRVLVSAEMLTRQARDIKNAACAWLHAHPSMTTADESDRDQHRRRHTQIQWHIRIIVEEAHAQGVPTFSGRYEVCKELLDEIERTAALMLTTCQSIPAQPHTIDNRASAIARRCGEDLDRHIAACDALIHELHALVGEGILQQTREQTNP